MKQVVFRFILAYLKFWASLQLTKLNPLIIGITGSNGKTSTLASVEAVLKEHRRIKVSHKANSEIGLPLDILTLKIKSNTISEWLSFIIKAPVTVWKSKKTYDIYVAEMGVDSPDPPQNMSYLLTFLKPTIGIFLNARAVHSEPFDKLAKSENVHDRQKEVAALIALEKGKLIEALPKSGTAILNNDDENVKETSNRSQASTLFFGKDTTATLHIKQSVQSLNGTLFQFKYKNEDFKLELPHVLLPHHYAYSIAPALLAGVACGISINEAVNSFKKHFKLPPGRSSLIEGINNSLILDSSYNASTQSMLDSLELLNLSKGRKLALLGDIRELGAVAQAEHEIVAQKILTICDEVFLVGPLMQTYVLPILEKKNIPVHWFPHAGEAGKHLQQVLKKDDMLLVKASQNTLLLEIAVEMLMAHPADDDTLLCRRDPFWDKKRKQILTS